MKQRLRNAPISVYFTISITIVLIAAIALLSSFAYVESRTHLVQLEDEHRAAAETSLVEYHRQMDRDTAFFDELFTARLRAAPSPPSSASTSAPAATRSGWISMG